MIDFEKMHFHTSGKTRKNLLYVQGALAIHGCYVTEIAPKTANSNGSLTVSVFAISFDFMLNGS